MAKTMLFSGKFKWLSETYGTLRDGIDGLLGEPQPQTPLPPIPSTPTPNSDTPDEKDEFNFPWESHANPLDNGIQLLNLLSGFYKAGFIFQREPSRLRVKAYFADEGYEALVSAWECGLEPQPPHFKTEEDLKPASLNLQPLIEGAGIKNLNCSGDLAFHFWLYPENQLSLALISDSPDFIRRKTILKTQRLIQLRFYD